MLMLHVSGFAYENFNPGLPAPRARARDRPRDCGNESRAYGAAHVQSCDRWEYSIGVDWCGQAPTGRPAGSLGWIDGKNGVGGLWATQLFPFADAAALASRLTF
jgi:hypothetical protein